MNHDWPENQEEHLWTRWFPGAPRKGSEAPTQYRNCIHPECNEVEYREVPNA